MRKGLSEAQVAAALGDMKRADLPAKTVAALRLADLLSAPQPMIDTATYQRLRAHLDDRELLELGAALSVASGWQRFIEGSVSVQIAGRRPCRSPGMRARYDWRGLTAVAPELAPPGAHLGGSDFP